MKYSIRWQLFGGLILVVILMIFFSWLLNNIYLEKYYIGQKTKTLYNKAEAINNLNDKDISNLDLQLEIYERNLAISAIILDKSLGTKHGPIRHRRTDSRIMLVRQYIDEINANGSVFLMQQDANLNTNFLYLLYLLDNGNYLVLSTPLAAIRENATIANQFFLFTGLGLILLAIGPIFLFAKRYTSPILELNTIAQNMANLDFNQKYKVKSKNEIGELGNSINSLSEQLSYAISDLQKANEKLAADVARERKIDEMRKEFISSVSHELKTPITLIQGYAEGLKVNIVQDEEEKDYYCDVIIDEADKMNKLVSDLLDLSQVESGYFKLEKEVFDLTKLINNVVNKYNLIINEKDIRIIVDMPLELNVWADISRTEQILLNYLNNALNHIDKQKILAINVEEKEGKAQIAIFNSGVNIPEEDKAHIFNSFYKVDKSRNRQYGGTGLGLSIVKAIQELGGNSYGVLNLENGVEFWFELDVAKDE